METALRRIPESERAALFGLVDQYLSELAAHRELPVGPRDAAGYQYLPLYWSEAGRHPFWIEADTQQAGFVLVREIASPDHGSVSQMSDFYVIPSFRRCGVGEAAAARVWQRFPGRWELQVHPRNSAAMAFWARAVAANATLLEKSEVREEDGSRLQYDFTIAASSG